MKFRINPTNKKRQFEIYISRAKENLKEAGILFKERGYRGAISRAYYGFFEAARAALITKGIAVKTHAGLITQFSLRLVKTNKIPAKFIRFFKQAREAREEADYEFLREFSKKEVEKIIQTADEFIKTIEKKFKRS